MPAGHFIFCGFNVLALFFQGEGMLPYFANFRLLAEFSTPCVNQRYVSSLRYLIQDSGSILMKINGLKTSNHLSS